ncbi:hypothetical protein BTO08_05955 [Photobacterium angustum]|uniref:Uncharacterized protein n=1 Tax=Photobacterium angustum TaxID=661 RepID=A0A2S7W231_PHOAN|nr:hypothetical protein BTO08_05955 [Photobacterium angustum]
MPSVLTVTVPFVGFVDEVNVKLSPSTSVADSLPLTATSSSVLTVMSLPNGSLLSSTITGASLIGFTVTLTVIVSVPPLPSLTSTLKLSSPWKLVLGV